MRSVRKRWRTNAKPRALPPSDPEPILRKPDSEGLNVSALKSPISTSLCSRRYSLMDSIKFCRKCSMVRKSLTLRGRSLAASANSVRAMSQWEKWLRCAWKAILSAGTLCSCSSSVFRSLARPTSVWSGMRNTKSPKPSCSVRIRRKSRSSVGERLRRKEYPSACARGRNSVRLVCKTTGTSGTRLFTVRASSKPASGLSLPSHGNSTSETTPNR